MGYFSKIDFDIDRELKETENELGIKNIKVEWIGETIDFAKMNKILGDERFSPLGKGKYLRSFGFGYQEIGEGKDKVVVF
ncbi:MAG: hypothetical protein RMJ18_02650, partial [Candidatus Aenigmarchaeota archaeon]|nr:hypothetical protein [Candidatus Aenigmarchaeota archaeon]MDW8160291.1 hypothetical protein [Candidatus Aenigmarchaeota archaeon]